MCTESDLYEGDVGNIFLIILLLLAGFLYS